MSGALALGVVGCGETKQNNPFVTLPPNAVSGTGGQAEAAAGALGTGGSGPGSATAGASGSTPIEPSAPIELPTAIDTPLTEIAKSSGCGKPYAGQAGAKVTIQTAGMKAADCADHDANGAPVCGAWATAREYYVNVPLNYDPNEAYPLIFESPGCGSNGTDIYPLPANSDTVIRIGLTPGPNSTGHGTHPEESCFDDKEGDDSIDWVFYESVYDRLNAELCFDRNRVFSGGKSSGAWFANELGCKYAGDTIRPVRAVLPNMGGLPTDPRFVPTCSQAPLAGIWSHELTSQTIPFSDAQVAIERAMSVAHCEGGHSYDGATFQSFPIGGNNVDDTCKRIVGCDPLYPLVVCAVPGNGRGVGDNIVVPAWSTFIKLFVAPPLLTP